MGRIQKSGHRPDAEVLRSTARGSGRGSALSNCKRGLLAALTVTTLAACSVHPLPDDVSPIPTEAIVAAARCELRLGLVDMVRVWFQDEKPEINPSVINPEFVADSGQFEKMMNIYKKFHTDDPNWRKEWEEYLDVAVAYDWTFDITETNHVDAGLGFKLPFINGNLDASGGGSVTAVRAGKRTFKSQDKISDLLTENWYNFCNDKRRSIDFYPNTRGPNQPFVERDPNLLYPITGSIGLGRAVKSFLKIAAQEGALDTFTDELTFTTTIDARVGAGLTLNPVPKQFRLVSASANVAGTRMDLHKVKISLAFPKARRAQKRQDLATSLEKELRAGRHLNPSWRASYALCVVDARSREDELKTLRLDPPEVTCLASTDAFFARESASRKEKPRDESMPNEQEGVRPPQPPGSITPLRR
jgi:hypothetical protein